MKVAINKISTTILAPIIKNPIFFMCQIAFMALPQILYYYIVTGNNWKYITLQLITASHIYLFDAYVISLLVLITNKFFTSNIIKTAYYALTIMLCVFHSFVIIFYQSHITPMIIRLIRETNWSEVRGFISTFNNHNLLYIAILIIAAITLVVMAEKILNNRLQVYFTPKNRPLDRGGGGNVLVTNILASIIIIVFPYNIVRNHIRSIAYLKCDNITSMEHYLTQKNTNFLKLKHRPTSYGVLIFSLYCDYTIKNDIKTLQSQLALDEPSNCTYRSKNIILIIGESYSKYHSNLYQYHLPTNPLLRNQLDSENLYVFQDVITPYCTTSYVMQEIFTFKSQDDNLYWANTPLFAKFFKENNYYTSFYSNQELLNQSQGSGNWDATNHFLVADQTAKYCYSATNYHIYRWDSDLVEEYKSRHSTIHYPHLTIFHLIGQHLDYASRHPSADTTFTHDDYKQREDLTLTQREMVAHYDNATVYNDKVIASIIDIYRDQDAIILYLSDHGEEIHDYRNFIGRTPTEKLTPEICKYQFEIPFMIWMSDEYKSTHPDVVKQVENSLDKPFMIDDLPHLMLDIAGIDCEWFDPTRSLINERYNANRKRLLLDSKIDYDEIIKQLTK